MGGCNTFPGCPPPINLDWVMAQLRRHMDTLCMLQRMVDELVLKNANNIERLDGFQMQVAELTLKVGGALDSVADLKGRTIVVEQDVVIIKTRVSNLENAVDDLSDDLAGITARMAANEAKDAIQDEDIIGLKVRVTNAENAATILTATVDTVIQRVGKTERDVTDLQIDNVANTAKIADLSGRVAGAELDIDILEGAYNNLSPRVSATEIVANDAQRRVGLVEIRAGALESSDTTQNAMLGDHQLKIVKAAQDIDGIEIGQRVQDDRLDLLEASDVAQGAGLTNITVRVTNAENRITVIENNTDSIGNLGTRVSNLESMSDVHETRITILEAGGGSGGDVDALVPRIVALELSDAQQNGDIGAINIAQGVQDAKIATLEAQDVLHGQQFSTLNGAVSAIEDVNSTQNGRLTTLEANQGSHGSRLNNLEYYQQQTINRVDMLENSSGKRRIMIANIFENANSQPLLTMENDGVVVECTIGVTGDHPTPGLMFRLVSGGAPYGGVINTLAALAISGDNTAVESPAYAYRTSTALFTTGDWSYMPTDIVDRTVTGAVTLSETMDIVSSVEGMGIDMFILENCMRHLGKLVMAKHGSVQNAMMLQTA